MPAPGDRRRVTEAGEIGRDDAHSREVSDDGLQPVVLAAEAMNGDDGDRRICRSVVPVRSRAAEH